MAPPHFADDTVAVMDAVGVERALLVGLCTSAWTSLLVAARHPERVAGRGRMATYGAVPRPRRCRIAPPSRGTRTLDTDEGWAKDNKHYWRRDYRGFTEFFFDQLLPEAHSTKQWEDAVGWAAESDVDSQIAAGEASRECATPAGGRGCARRRSRCPVLAIHGEQDALPAAGRAASASPSSPAVGMVSLEGVGHLPQARYPVLVNRLLHDFLDEVAPLPPAAAAAAACARPRPAPPRALFISSPIGLGHARRDLGIARALRAPPTRRRGRLADPGARSTGSWPATGEQVHPGCAELANESAHFEESSGEHDLHAFQALRDMDEILVHNFMVFSEIVEQGQYDLVVGDEAWDVDHFLHEHPELKRTRVRLGDRLRRLRCRSRTAATARTLLTADYNAEMVEHLARAPAGARPLAVRRRPRGRRAATVSAPGLPSIREWTDATFDFCGYVTGFDPVPDADRAGVRAELGYRDDEQVCLVTVGGSGVGLDLLRRVVAAYPQARAAGPGAAHGRRHRPADRPARSGAAGRRRARPGTGSRCARTCTTCGGTWRCATSPSCRAGSPRRWS